MTGCQAKENAGNMSKPADLTTIVPRFKSTNSFFTKRKKEREREGEREEKKNRAKILRFEPTSLQKKIHNMHTR